MNYKKIIKNRRVRLAILRILSFVPDRMMIKLQYFIKTGRKLNLKDPKRFTEKLQWYKLYYKNPLMVTCVDKWEVRRYIEGIGLGHLLNKVYGVYERVEDIDFDALPDAFVLKDTLGMGGESVIIVDDKKTADLAAIRKRLVGWMNRPSHLRDGGREWPYYSGKKRRIMIEEYLEAENPEIGLIDYKASCFGGKFEYYYAMCGRKVGESTRVGIYDKDFRKLPVRRVGCDDTDDLVPRPRNLQLLCEVAEHLAAPFPQVRVDLYEIKGELRFGELTFFLGSGYVGFDPDDMDFEMGNLFVLPAKHKKH